MFEAATAPSGLTERVTRKPDLLILDMGLPGGSGLDIIREVRTWSGVPTVVLSARSDEKRKIAALDAGADDCLTKPFGIGELLAAPGAGQRRGPGAQAPPIAARSRGAVACLAKPLHAHLQGAFAAQARSRPSTTGVFFNRDGGGLPAGLLGKPNTRLTTLQICH